MKTHISWRQPWNWTWFGEAVLLAFVALVFVVELPIATRDPNAGKLNVELVWKVDLSNDSARRFDSPLGLTVDSAGNVYVADRGNKRVQKFSPTGDPSGLWTGDSAGEHPFAEPSGLALDRGGKAVWILDGGNGWLYRLEENGTMVAAIDGGDLGLYNPRGLATSPAGDFFIADTGNGRVIRLDQQGNLIKKWGSYGSKGNQLGDPTGIVVDGNDVFVVDVANNRVVDFNLNGDPIGSWEVDVESAWIAADGKGHIIVSDHHTDSVSAFNRKGKLLGKMAGGDVLSPVDAATGMMASPDGRLWMVGASELAMYQLHWK